MLLHITAQSSNWTATTSSAQVVPRLTFRQLGSVATSADALSPLGRVRAKPEPEPATTTMNRDLLFIGRVSFTGE